MTKTNYPGTPRHTVQREEAHSTGEVTLESAPRTGEIQLISIMPEPAGTHSWHGSHFL
jgi:hypothetical protein